MSKKTLIYDTSKVFSITLKKYFSKKMDLHICTKKKNLKNYKISDYDFFFFTVNEIEDLQLLKDIYFEVEHVFITSTSKNLHDKLMTLEFPKGISIYFDYSKNDIVKAINLTLSKIV